VPELQNRPGLVGIVSAATLFSAGLKARLHVSQDGRRHHFQASSKRRPEKNAGGRQVRIRNSLPAA
jgi:hypothetical protein